LTPALAPSYTGAVTRPLVLALALVVAGSPVTSAEHEVHYRFVVLGYVTDARGHPLPNRPIALIRDKTGFSYVDQTDDDGFYLIISRLGDESVDERLTLTIGTVVTTLTARFDPKNHADDRGTRVDIVAGTPVERAAWFPSTLRNFLGSK
jgi:hypothetical protein